MKYSIATILFILCVSSCQLDPCSNKKSFTSSFEKFTDEVSKSNETMQATDWKTWDAKFDKYVSECYVQHKNDMTIEERKQFWINSVKYYYKRHGKSLFTELNNTDDPLASMIKKEMDNVFQDPNESIIAVVKEVFGDDLNSTIDKVVNDVKKLGEELKDLLNQ